MAAGIRELVLVSSTFIDSYLVSAWFPCSVHYDILNKKMQVSKCIH
jgi:hypothetical protein